MSLKPSVTDKLVHVMREIAEKRAATVEPIPAESAAETVPEAAPAEQSGPDIPGKSIVPTLNKLLTSEFVAIHQYTAHYALLKNMGYEKLAKSILEHLDDERKHADALAYRIAFLGGTPEIAAKLDAAVGKTVPAMFTQDLGKEEGAIRSYNDAIVEAVEARDTVTREMLEKICRDEDHHVDEITTYQDQIDDMGIGPFLVTQI